MNWEKFFTFIGWFLLCCLVCSFIGLLIAGITLGFLFLLQYNVYIAVGVVIGVASLGMAIVIMKED